MNYRPHRRRSRRFSPILILPLLLIVILVAVLCLRGSSGGESEQPLNTDPQSTVSPAPDTSESVSNSAATPETSAPPDSTESVSPAPSQPVKETEIPWNLTLVNADHPLPEGFTVETTELPNGLSYDSRAYAALIEMLEACEAEGLEPIVCSAYRTVTRQTELFENKINKYLADGLSYDEAYAAAATVIAIPGTSEHNLGLAADICALSYQVLDKDQENTAEQQWLMAHCHEYGFILRYPEDKTDITGIIYEPWHYRYVGKEAAAEIMSSGMCLEEYMELYYEID